MKHLLLFLTFLTFYSCKTTESLIYYSEFRFINETDSTFFITGYNQNRLNIDLKVNPTATTTISKEYEHTPLNPGQFFDSDSIEVKLINGKKLIYSWNRPSPTKDYLGNGLGWSESKVDENHYIYSYTFTQEHIDSAR